MRCVHSFSDGGVELSRCQGSLSRDSLDDAKLAKPLQEAAPKQEWCDFVNTATFTALWICGEFTQLHLITVSHGVPQIVKTPV